MYTWRRLNRFQWLPPSRLFAHDRMRHCFECWWMLGDQKFPSQEAFITRSFLCLLWCWDFQCSSSSFRYTLMTEALPPVPPSLTWCIWESSSHLPHWAHSSLFNLPYVAISHKLAASWLAQPNHFFPVFASVSLKSMSSWDRGLSWLLSHLGNHDIYRLSRTGLGERTENGWRGSR